MKQFFKFTFASCLGVLISSILVIIFLVSMLGSLVSTEESVPEIKDNSVLYIKLDKPIYDREVSDLSMLGGIAEGEIGSSIGLTEFLYVLERAKTDDRIKAIMLDITLLQANGWATIEEVKLYCISASIRKTHSVSCIIFSKFLVSIPRHTYCYIKATLFFR